MRTTPRTPVTGGLADLTPREHEVLSLIARGVANAEIAAELVSEPFPAPTVRLSGRNAHPAQGAVTAQPRSYRPPSYRHDQTTSPHMADTSLDGLFGTGIGPNVSVSDVVNTGLTVVHDASAVVATVAGGCALVAGISVIGNAGLSETCATAAAGASGVGAATGCSSGSPRSGVRRRRGC